MALNPIPRPIILAVGASGPIIPVSEPATMESRATQIPTRSPRSAYTTPRKWNGWDASRMNFLPKDLNRQPSLIKSHDYALPFLRVL